MRLIFKLERETEGYDELRGAVVCAETAANARAVVATRARDEGPGAWLDVMTSTCDRVGIADDGTAIGVILFDFKAG